MSGMKEKFYDFTEFMDFMMLQVNESRLNEDLEQSWEVLAEPIQTVIF